MPKLVVPKSTVWFIVVVEDTSALACNSALAGPCLTVVLSTGFLTSSGCTFEFLTTFLVTEVRTISLCFCPLITFVGNVIFKYLVSSTFFSNKSWIFLVCTLSTSFVKV